MYTVLSPLFYPINQRLMGTFFHPIDTEGKLWYTDTVKQISQKEAIIMTNVYGSDVVFFACTTAF